MTSLSYNSFGDKMISIKENNHNEIIINKSKFITKLIKIKSEHDVDNILNDIKSEYVGATHYCYAYVCGNKKKFNDDGEPTKTAGMPILNVLESNNLDNILCVVIRYFGGIKLGAGGLVRAYTKATTECLKKVKLVNLVDGTKIKINFDYSNLKQIDYLLSEINIEDKFFENEVTYTFNISNKKLEIIYDDLVYNTINILKIEKILIEE
jgi:uncharacterized YigZ family protein